MEHIGESLPDRLIDLDDTLKQFLRSGLWAALDRELWHDQVKKRFTNSIDDMLQSD